MIPFPVTKRERALFDARWAGWPSVALAGRQATRRIAGVTARNRLRANDARTDQVPAAGRSGWARHPTAHANRFFHLAERGAVSLGVHA